MFIRFDMIHERDRQTNGQTDGHRMTAIAALMHSIARQKRLQSYETFSIDGQCAVMGSCYSTFISYICYLTAVWVFRSLVKASLTFAVTRVMDRTRC